MLSHSFCYETLTIHVEKSDVDIGTQTDELDARIVDTGTQTDELDARSMVDLGGNMKYTIFSTLIFWLCLTYRGDAINVILKILISCELYMYLGCNQHKSALIFSNLIPLT